MRGLADRGRIEALLRALGQAGSARPVRIYLTGGATAVLIGWRASTIDVDLRLVPDQDDILRAIPRLKEELHVNVELASPSDFIPELPGWETRSLFVVQEGKVSFHHYDFYAQALAKLERGHTQDRADVDEMLRRELVEPRRLLALFAQIEPDLYRYPAVDPASFRKAVEACVARWDT